MFYVTTSTLEMYLDKYADKSPVIISVFDHDEHSFEFISKSIRNVLGYTSEEMTGKPMEYFRFLLEASHAKLYKQQVLPILNNKIGELVMSNELDKIRINFEIKLTSNDGAEKWMLCNACMIEVDEHGLPLKTLIFFTDITSMKHDETIDISIEMCNLYGYYEVIFRTRAFPVSKEINLSMREIEILKLIAQGMNSKEIADKLCLSYHTIVSHRKKMLSKTNTKNTMELISIAQSKRII